jgi:hypothetical protein
VDILMFMHRLSCGIGPRSLVSAILIALLGTAGAAPSEMPTVSTAHGADASSDIPGVLLPGPVAAGRLGGAIYDVVYSFTVAPGHVIVASVTGTDGTDFDTYLFDATATTVLSTTGLLTKSTGPTSTESLSWPSQFGGTYYIDLNGATDVEGDYRLTVQTVPDPTPPVVSIALAAGHPSTNQATIPVTLVASDDLSGVTEMALSADGVSFEAWRPFRSESTWTFATGDGVQTLWARVRNGVGLASVPASDSVVIDTVAPSAVAFDPAPNSSVSGLRPRFAVSFEEPMDAASWIDLGLIVQSATGALVPGNYTYDVVTRTGTFTPSLDLQPGATYVVTVGNVKDVAGNRVLALGSWSVTPLTPTSLAATADLRVIHRGGTARIEVALTGAPLPATVEVLSATSPAGFVPLTVISTDDGTNSLAATPASNTTFRFRYAGAFGVAPDQVDVRVLVRRSVALVGRDSSVVAKGRVGSQVKLTAAISPAAPGVSVSFRLYRFDAGRRAWVYAGSRGRNTDAAGRASYAWTPTSPGSWYWRATTASTAEFANNVSPVYRWSVSR